MYTKNWCEGCRFHKYPYEAEIPLESREIKTFKCDEDIWDVVYLIIDETKEMNKKMRKDFDIEKSVSDQLRFFACPNIVLNQSAQRDISRYTYCNKFSSVSPFDGSYKDQPYKWISKVNIIEKCIANIEKDMQRRQNIKINSKVGR